jgi:hypothetical protein
MERAWLGEIYLMIVVGENEAGQHEKERNASVAKSRNLALKYAARDASVMVQKDIQGSKKAKRCQGFEVLDRRVRRCPVANVVHAIWSFEWAALTADLIQRGSENPERKTTVIPGRAVPSLLHRMHESLTYRQCPVPACAHEQLMFSRASLDQHFGAHCHARPNNVNAEARVRSRRHHEPRQSLKRVRFVAAVEIGFWPLRTCWPLADVRFQG